MASKQSENPFDDNDPSRLPCGVLETFVYSADRRSLLNPSTNKDDEKKYENDEKKANKSVFVDGNEEHRYYQMLQIGNEIEALLFNKVTNSEDRLKQLNAEMKKLIDEEEKSMFIHTT